MPDRKAVPVGVEDFKTLVDKDYFLLIRHYL